MAVLRTAGKGLLADFSRRASAHVLSAHQAALLKLKYAVENRHAAALLVGDSGVGKTLITRHLQSLTNQPADPVVNVLFPLLTPTELLAFVTAELG